MPHREPEHGSAKDGGQYGLEASRLAVPALPGDVVVVPEADELIDLLAADLVVHAENCVREFGDFHLALSGGPIFEPLYTRLMYDPDYRRLPWRRTHLWLVEEPCVPFDDERSNYRMISEIVGDHADIPSEQFHPIFAMSDTAVEDYETLLREALGWREPGQDRLDYALLTMGRDGGVVGLTPAPGEETLAPDTSGAAPVALVRRHASPDGRRPTCVAMTTAFINAARFVVVLVTGADMADAVRRLARPGVGPREMPIKGIEPLNGELRWYLDGPAAGEASADDTP